MGVKDSAAPDLNRRVMRTSYIAAMLIVVASPAFGQSEHRAKAQRAWQATSQDVHGGRFNTDPDPNVRFEIMRQRNWRKG